MEKGGCRQAGPLSRAGDPSGMTPSLYCRAGEAAAQPCRDLIFLGSAGCRDRPALACWRTPHPPAPKRANTPDQGGREPDLLGSDTLTSLGDFQAGCAEGVLEFWRRTRPCHMY